MDIYDWLMLTYHRQEQPVYPFKERRDAKKKLSKMLFSPTDDKKKGGGAPGEPFRLILPAP